MNIKETLRKHGYTITSCAEKMGISQPSLTQIINGNMKISSLQRIADAIGCPVGDFFLDEQEDRLVTRCPHCGKKIEINTTDKKRY